jgi:hypothetical protein
MTAETAVTGAASHHHRLPRFSPCRNRADLRECIRAWCISPDAATWAATAAPAVHGNRKHTDGGNSYRPAHGGGSDTRPAQAGQQASPGSAARQPVRHGHQVGLGLTELVSYARADSAWAFLALFQARAPARTGQREAAGRALTPSEAERSGVSGPDLLGAFGAWCLVAAGHDEFRIGCAQIGRPQAVAGDQIRQPEERQPRRRRPPR